MLQCWAKIESGDAMWSPRGASNGLVVNDDASAYWCNWVLGEVESATMQSSICRNGSVRMEGDEVIEAYFNLW
jgi:hypothetical protein